ncbi:hypothetical protein HYH03_015526 [Edaphochlamys debaryana]|uniref:VPS10 domain-containing protein n=1 Tax=Edaphochlamys debaryana TaxID=47281 RepID=A0A836BQV7_9CHLO|nr:hypothetical protein HYH03_015526 [Edaphochlamys debaryana]|eukprot:KAG2485816.1 hypothetical protein HYH03_015526 [Edaphochlamys debaryana]
MDVYYGFDGDDNKVVFVSAREGNGGPTGSLWRSLDGGRSFANVTGRLEQATQAANGTSAPAAAGVISVLGQISRPGRVLVLGRDSWAWVSQDSGESYTAVPLPWWGTDVLRVMPHPRAQQGPGAGPGGARGPGLDGWLLVLATRNCGERPCPQGLWLNRDALNASSPWEDLAAGSGGRVGGFADARWGAELCGPQGDVCPGGQAIPDPRILATVYPRGTVPQPGWSMASNFMISDDWFVSYNRTTRPCANGVTPLGSLLVVGVANGCPADGARYGSDYGASWVSSDGGASFAPVCFAPKPQTQSFFWTYPTLGGRGAAIALDRTLHNAADTSSPYEASTLHLLAAPPPSAPSAAPSAAPAPAPAAVSSVGLLAVRGGTASAPDFLVVDGAPATFIANVPMQPFALDPGVWSTEAGVTRTETRISFNGGASWQPIPAPTSFAHAECAQCAGRRPCSLHLWGASTWTPSSWAAATTVRPAIYSHPAAPGLVIANGNVGRPGVGLGGSADGSPEGTCTWLSTDGGATWRDVAVGLHVYEYGDAGGVVALAKHASSGQPATEVQLSFDYGSCWKSVPLRDALYVDNIRSPTRGAATSLLLHGRVCPREAGPKCTGTDDDFTFWGPGPRTVLYGVDVAAAMGGTGAGGRPAACGPGDYVPWRPAGPGGAPLECVLGRPVVPLQRRKAGARCLNAGAQRPPPPVGGSCGCGAEEYRCEYGFTRDYVGSNGTTTAAAAAAPASEDPLQPAPACVPLPSNVVPTCPSIDSGAYTPSPTGQRLISAGGQCAAVPPSPPRATAPRGAHAPPPRRAPTTRPRPRSSLRKFMPPRSARPPPRARA